MAEGGPGRGRGGRGAVIAKLLEMGRRPGQPPVLSDENEGIQEQVQQETPLPRPGGRGAMLLRMQQLAQERVQQGVTEPTPSTAPQLVVEPSPVAQPMPLVGSQPITHPPMSKGRGRLMEMMTGRQIQPTQQTSATHQFTHHTSTTPQPTQQTSVTPQPTQQDAEIKNVTRRVRQLEINTDTPPVVMKGSSGRNVSGSANYIYLEFQPGRGVYEYEVRFTPPVDDRASCTKLLFVQHKELFKGRRTFDGVTLYLPYRLDETDTNLISVHPVTNETHSISLIFKRESSLEHCVHLFNVLFNNIQKELKLVRLGRDYFSQSLAVVIPQHRLEIWPGYVTSVDVYEGGLMLNCNVSHKTLRTMTVLDVIEEIIHTSNGGDWKTILQKAVIGQSVMTRAPVNMYRIDDIDFSRNPLSTFTHRDGTEMTYADYQLRYDIHIKDTRQPLLVHRPKPSKRPHTESILLIPEVCYMTGLTDEMRSDYRVMKDVAVYNKLNPNERHRSIQKFIDNVKATPSCVKLLDEWGLKLPDDTINLPVRIMPYEKLYFGGGYVDKGSEQADWGRAATTQIMLEVINITNWIVIHTQKDERNARGFIEMMAKVCPQMGVDIRQPEVLKIRDDRTETYLRTLREGLNPKVQIAVVIFPSARDDRYSAIKKLCCVDHPIASQVINSRTISKQDKLRSVVQKIALQVNCKLGGALWSVQIPFASAMICGIDTYHDTKNRGQSVAAFVASMNQPVTRWHSQVFMQSTSREMVDGLRSAMYTALVKFAEINGRHPDTVVIFRDGVGDGQLKACEEHEVQVLQKAFCSISPDYNPPMIFIVCQKRINTRIFMHKQNGFENPPPGSVLDHTITRRYLFDFFLVSQLVRQGTVTPTHYVVLHNSTKLDADKIQKLTYKMCHLYYNWPGTVRVPAPCQYAHKLAHLVGCSIHKEPSEVLCHRLFFL